MSWHKIVDTVLWKIIEIIVDANEDCQHHVLLRLRNSFSSHQHIQNRMLLNVIDGFFMRNL